MADGFTSQATQVISKLGYTVADSPEEIYDEIVIVLDTFHATLKNQESLQWSPRVEDLIFALKTYIIYYDRHTNTHKLPSNQDGVSSEKLANMGNLLGKTACEILIGIADRLPAKDNYNFFSAFVLKQSPASYSLMEIFKIKDDSSEHRTSSYIAYNSVMKVLMIAVEKAKPTLGFAESKNVRNYPATYTAFSMTIAFALEDIMNTLISVIDEALPRIDCGLVCDVLVLVAESCPFHRLHSSVFSVLVSFVARQLNCRPANIPRRYILRLAILCIGQNTKFSEDEVSVLFAPQVLSLKGATFIAENGIDSEKPGTGPVTVSNIAAKSISFLNYWMTCAVLGSENMKNSSELALLDIDLMIALTKNYFHTFKWDSIICLETCIHVLSFLPVMIVKSSNPKMPLTLQNDKAHAVAQVLQYLVEVALTVSKYIDEYEPVDEKFLTGFIKTWDLFFEIAPELMSMDTVSIQKGVADCFAAFGSGLFERISPERQTFCVVSVLGWCRDDRNSVRAKGGRCLAHLVAHRLLAEDEHFLLDALDVMEENLINGDHATRGSFAWCLGNYTESLLAHHKDSLPPNFASSDFDRLCQLCFACAKDKAKIRYNAHRAIGSLFGWSPEILVHSDSQGPLFERSIAVLLNQIGTGTDFKARWNASHAMGVILENEQLLLTYPNILEPVLKHMGKVVYKSENFKERIQCIFTLTRLRNRLLYGQYFWGIWQGVLQSVSVPEDLRPSEIAHVEKLKIEACLAVCHFISLLDVKDVREVEKVIEGSTNLLCDVRNSGSVLPERIHLINEALENVDSLSASYETPLDSIQQLSEALKDLR